MTGVWFVLITAALFPGYLALRRPFFDLPLHMDTGFYVSNHTICTRTLRFARGWNATCAGCSKVLPEWFYSVVYLRHGGRRYPRAARFYASLYNYVTAMLVGTTVAVLGGGILGYTLGLLVYCLVSSEPQYGVYFENAELFEVLFQIGGVLLMLVGVQQQHPLLVAAGAGLWWIESFFVKLSSLVASGMLTVGVILLSPTSLLPVLMTAATVAALYSLWVKMNGQQLLRLLRPVIRHEYYSHLYYDYGVGRSKLLSYVRRAFQKARFLWSMVLASPVFCALVVGGVISAVGHPPLLLLYALAVLIVYFLQAGNIWYYAILCLPVLAVWASCGLQMLLTQGLVGWLLAGVGLGAWLLMHLDRSFGRVRRGGLAFLNESVWQPYGAHGLQMARANFQLAESIASMRPLTQGRSVFIAGPLNQAYVLLDASYDTTLISAADWLDLMSDGWSERLNRQFRLQPPDLLLETEPCLETTVLKERLGLDYRLVEMPQTASRLFQLQEITSLRDADLTCRPFQFRGIHPPPQETPALAGEECDSPASARCRPPENGRRRMPPRSSQSEGGPASWQGGQLGTPDLPGGLHHQATQPTDQITPHQHSAVIATAQRIHDGPHVSGAQPLVTVVIPSLNRARFLIPTIESVLQQDYPQIECLVIDGGSTDETLTMLQRYAGRFRWISEPDRGQADAINKGWRMGHGEILAWLNADDCWAVPHAVSDVVAYLQAHPDVDLVYGRSIWIDGEGRTLGPAYWKAWDLAYAVERCNGCIPQPAAFMRRRILEQVGGLDPSLTLKCDHELWLRIGLVGTIRDLPAVVAKTRVCRGSYNHLGHLTARACVALTEKFFTLPNVPASLQQRRRIALSGAYLRGAQYAAREGMHLWVAFRYVLYGLWLSPSNVPHLLRYALSLFQKRPPSIWWLRKTVARRATRPQPDIDHVDQSVRVA